MTSLSGSSKGRKEKGAEGLARCEEFAAPHSTAVLRFSGGRRSSEGMAHVAGRLAEGWSQGFPQGGFVMPLSETCCHCLQQSLRSRGSCVHSLSGASLR